MAYVTYSEAETIYETMLPKKVWTWDGTDYTYQDVFNVCTETEAERFLEAATTWINQQIYDGEVSDSATGSNQFPRNTNTTVPTEVEQACVALACHYAVVDTMRENMDPEMVMEMDAHLQSQQVTLGTGNRTSKYGKLPTEREVVTPYLKRWLKTSFKTASYSREANISLDFFS